MDKSHELVRKGLNLWAKSKITWTHIAIYVNGITFILTTSVWYKVSGIELMDHYLGFVIPYYIFFLILVGTIALFGFAVEWKVSMPAVFRAQQDLLYTSSKIFRGDIEKIMADNTQLKKDNDELKSQLETIIIGLEGSGIIKMVPELENKEE